MICFPGGRTQIRISRLHSAFSIKSCRINYTWKLLSLLFSSICLRCGLILLNGFRFNEKYLIWKRVPEQKSREMTSQNCNLIGYSTHVASNFIMRDIKNFTEKLFFIIFTKIFHNLTITIHKHVDHIWLKSLPVLWSMAISNKKGQLNYTDD